VRLGKRSKRIVLLATLVTILVAVGVLAFYQIQQEQLVSFLTEYGAYDAKFKYEPLAVVDIDSLPKPTGNLTAGKLIITYAFHPADNVDNVPYVWLTYVSAPPCSTSATPSSGNCQQLLLIIPNNNVTPPNRQHALYASPLNSFGFELYTGTGAHIEWHLDLFLATYNGPGNAEPPSEIIHSSFTSNC
jgi:hypothetical protein